MTPGETMAEYISKLPSWLANTMTAEKNHLERKIRRYAYAYSRESGNQAKQAT
jgi:hypothetical protein